MKTHRLFAYGSNLCPSQMIRRCPSARLLAPGDLVGYRLVFAGHSVRWGGAVADVRPSRALDTPGLVWEVSSADLERMDGFEGAPHAYDRAELLVRLYATGRTARVWVYRQSVRRALAAPSRAYITQIGNAYHDFGFNSEVLHKSLFELSRVTASRKPRRKRKTVTARDFNFGS